MASTKRPTAHPGQGALDEPVPMTRHPIEYRCELCRRRVEDDLRSRARRGWEALIICDACLRQAGSIDDRRLTAAAAAA
jgi:hypothetical protein